MTKKRNTKRALLASVLSMMLCMAMLIGSTFAWFTDNATTNVNTIEAGTLNIDIQDNEGNSLEGQTLKFEDKDNNKLWEPGVTYTLPGVKIVNKGSLALKFKLLVNGIEGDGAKLADVLEVKVGEQKIGILSELMKDPDGIAYGTLEVGKSTKLYNVSLHMQESAGNAYQGLKLDNISFTVYATQHTSEEDSYSNQYDENAEYNKNLVKTGEELKKLLTEASDAGSGNVTVTLTNNITLAEGETWTPVKVDGYHGAGVVTIEGNGCTISGLTAPLFAGGFAGASGIVIKDLTIADSDIVSTNETGSGAFIEAIDSMPTITLENCHVKNSTITGSRTGGLIGWNSGYNNTNDGPVKTYVTIKNCSVTDCEITGAGTVGGIVGHAGANAWTWNTIENCKVENCELTSNDDSYRVGAIVGTANVGEVTITNCTSTGNTIKQNNNSTEITRPEGQSELYGRFVPQNGSGKLTIDGVEIK